MKILFLPILISAFVLSGCNGTQKNTVETSEEKTEEQTQEIAEVDCDAGRPVTLIYIAPEEQDMALEECKKGLDEKIQSDSAYHFVWGTSFQYMEKCAQKEAREIADFEMDKLLQEVYNKEVKNLNFNKEEVYIKSQEVAGGWYVCAVGLRVKKDEIRSLKK